MIRLALFVIVLGLAMLLGPVLKGRNYLRELSLWSKMIDEPMQIKASSQPKFRPGRILKDAVQ